MEQGLKWLGLLAALLAFGNLCVYLRVTTLHQTAPSPVLHQLKPPSATVILANKARLANEYMRCVTSPNSTWVPREPGVILPDWRLNKSESICPNILHPFTVNTTNRTGLFYTWRPPIEASCRDLEPFSRERFCQVMHGRRLYLVGDSITGEFYGNMRFLFGEHMVDKPGMPKSWCSPKVILNCPTPFPPIPLAVVWSPLLDKFPAPNQTFDHDSVFLLNSGAHFRETPLLLDTMRKCIGRLLESNPNVTIVWRTTTMGHDFATYPGIRPFTSRLPLLIPSPPINLTSIGMRFPGYFKQNYSWHRFEEQNLAMMEMLTEEFPNVLYLDVYHMDRLALDGMRDGLHFCIPSQRKEWAGLLMNALIRIEK
ncbi:hypothetical protein BASA81_005537 [Batrachochytrium salamandrivorans]|nr:hypothetical protein BASA81_005537 [Batrachochytrium salamandrivorans]